MTGSPDTRLIMLRGNSASGKSTIAQRIRERFGRGVAIIGQDMLRRQILREHDVPGGVNIGLIDITARHALDHGFHVVLEGILRRDHYGEMLERLCADHRGITRCYYLDIPLEETLRRHTTKPQAHDYGETEMREWYRPLDVIDELNETRIGTDACLSDAVARVMRDTGLDRR